MTTTLARAMRAALTKAADPSKAEAMRAYMKSSMPYLGVSAAPFRAVCREVFPQFPIDDGAQWRADALALFLGAKFREERYAAVEWTGDRRAKKLQTLEALPMYEEMIVTGAWWDIVDALATHRLRLLLERHPREMKKEMRAWSKCADMWKRRSAILCQVGRKEETDLDLLYACIDPSLPSKEFFLRKAIGWALRQYAWTDPREVLRYVREHRAELSGLSKREALKNVIKSGLCDAVP